MVAKPTLDVNVKDEYVLTIRGDDGGSPPISVNGSVTIKVNDTAQVPVLQADTVFQVDENLADQMLAGVNVDGASVPVQDPDQNEHFTWTIVENDEDAFNISVATGDISTRAGLNYEYRTSYLIKVSRARRGSPRPAG